MRTFTGRDDLGPKGKTFRRVQQMRRHRGGVLGVVLWDENTDKFLSNPSKGADPKRGGEIS